MSKSLLKSTAVVSVMTLVSRVSGLVRDVVMANILGSSGLADAFFVAFRIPVLTVLGIVFAPFLVSLYAMGYNDDPTQFQSTVDALRVMFPYLFCISLVAMSGGILNTLNRFAVPAVTPVLLNICMILAMWLLVPHMSNAAQALAVGVLIAGVVQLLFQMPSLLKEGYLPSFKIDTQNPAMRRVFTLMLPAVFSVSVAQVNMFVNTVLASFLVTGSVSWLYYSDRLMEFPSAFLSHDGLGIALGGGDCLACNAGLVRVGGALVVDYFSIQCLQHQ